MKTLYIFLGSISLALGILGIFLPLLPTSPLLFYVTIFLLAAGTGIGALGSYISLRKFLRV